MENFIIDLGAGLWKLVSPVLTALSPLLIGLILAYLLNPADWPFFLLTSSFFLPLSVSFTALSC